MSLVDKKRPRSGWCRSGTMELGELDESLLAGHGEAAFAGAEVEFAVNSQVLTFAGDEVILHEQALELPFGTGSGVAAMSLDRPTDASFEGRLRSERWNPRASHG